MKASKEEIEHNTRSSSVRLRAVELCRPIPNRWLNRLQDEAYGLEHRKGGR